MRPLLLGALVLAAVVARGEQECAASPDECSAQEAKERLAEASKLAKAAEQAYMGKKYRDSINMYGKAIKLDPENEKYLYKRSRSLSKVGRYEQELKDLNRVLDLKPDYLAAIAFRAKAHLNLGDCESATRDFEWTLSKKPTHGDAKKMLPRARVCASKLLQVEQLILQKRYDMVENILSQLMESVGGKSVKFVLMRAEARFHKGHYFEAIADCGELLKKHADNLQALLLRGASYYNVGDHEMAQRHFKEVLSKDPDHKEAKARFKSLQKIVKLTALGEKKLKVMNMESWQEALDAFDQARKIDPGHSVHNKYLSMKICTIYAQWNELAQARTFCEEAINMDPEYLEPYIVYAELATKLAEDTPQFEDALRAWQRAHEVDRNDPRIREGMHKAEVGLKQSKQKNYYKILGVSRRAETGEIKRAYRKLAKEYHPDRHGDKSEEERQQMEEKFQLVAEAYEVLSSDELRGKYDRGEEVFENQGNDNRRGGFHQPFFRRGGFNFGRRGF